MPFDVFQQVFGLSMASNAVNNFKGTQTNLQARLQAVLPGLLPLLGEWAVVWGPVVWKVNPDNDKSGPDNSWYVAHNPAVRFEDGTIRPAYVLAIAGTADSEYDWPHENFWVNQVAAFDKWVAAGIKNVPEPVPGPEVAPGGTYIAMGTVNAVHTLLTVAPPPGAAAAGSTLIDFFSDLPATSTRRILTTGHSLGGALSPTIALALVTSGVLHPQEVLTFPTAGPSPGNHGFTDLFNQTFPQRLCADASARGYQVWNLNIANSIDIVPQAWCHISSESPAQNLDNIPTIYGKPALSGVNIATFLLKFQAARSKTVYIPLQSHIVPGTPPKSPPGTMKEFLAEASKQHVQFYLDLFGIQPPPSTPNEVLRRDGLVLKSGKEEIRGYPVIGRIEWVREHPEEAKAEVDAAEARGEGKLENE
ncbi:uncharacterized protein FIBRA_02492 [Fibroporia radiculosa]|uniref:Fungal lipase-type domain-containing protein n=1 Tax=Fibroporia radiculosa TaxID=599839 RepID=J4H1W0_9APHY|nr:uncharacterized protein FIBRA_02492 [Fibroporia radiculosa]CCM00459.1 predicted protein [Fibroporia radiculosa]